MERDSGWYDRDVELVKGRRKRETKEGMVDVLKAMRMVALRRAM